MGCTFIVGGSRSGKSLYAERLAARWSDVLQSSVTYIATATRSDEEMEKRILRHRRMRPVSWLTLEEPLDVASVVEKLPEETVILLDCLSLLLNNWMFIENCNEEDFQFRLSRFLQVMQRFAGHVIVVSNEVGQGIVPADPLTRQYRDWLGWFNQAVASISDSVIMVVAGVPVDLKKFEAQWP